MIARALLLEKEGNVALKATALILLLALTAFAEAPNWIQWLPASSPATAILYRMVPSLAGTVPVRRPPAETAPQLAMLGLRNPSDTEIIALTAREYEAQLDFSNAEARWKLLDSVSPDKAGNEIQLADYYHRRMQTEQELQALTAAETLSPATDDPLKPTTGQRAWGLHERAQRLIQAEAMPADRAIQDYESWIAKYPSAETVQRRYFEFLLSSGMTARAQEVLNQYEKAFPSDRSSIVHQQAELAEKRGAKGRAGGAIAVYDAAYDPLWPPDLLNDYFKLLDDSHRSFEFYQNARRAALARPLDLGPATRLFHYYRKQGDINAARRELSEFRVRREAARPQWKASELNILAKLSDSVNDYDETIRYAYALYSLPGSDNASAESALVEIIGVLLKAPDQPIRFGRGDLSFYHDIATIDSSPGFLNGILSLIFNSQYPDVQFRSQERKSEAYFHRAKAAELYKLLSDRFPNSSRRSELLSQLIESYAGYGEDEAIIRQGTAFISEFPNAEQRTKVALQVADAYARRKQVSDEIGIYDRLLRELAAKAQQVPLGGGQQPRSPEYAQVLQRYLSRLSQLNRIPEALALYRAEIDRNPNDPGLYDGLAGFLGAHQRASEVEQVYRLAMQRFQDRSWRQKLARFYLRSRMTNELQALSRQMIDTFAGSDVEAYMSDVIADAALEQRLQVDINLYALNRFPHDLRFVHNLTSLYSGGATANPTALMRLLAEHWYDDEGIRRMYFERLAAAGSLNTVLRTAANLLPPASAVNWRDAESANPLITRFIGEGTAWQSHFESAATPMQAVAAAYPSDVQFAGRTSELYRSLAAYDKNLTSVAVSIAEDLSRAEPRSRERLTRIGEIYADHEMPGAAAAAWKRIPAIEPGKPESYLDTATVFWDYLRPADALDWLHRGRVQLKNPTLWSYEVGAILESEDLRRQAVDEYMQGALNGSDNRSRSRLIALAPRPNYKPLVDDQTRRKLDASPANPDVLQLRLSVLRAQKRNPEIEPLLKQAADHTSSRELLQYVQKVADESSLKAVQTAVFRREIQLETDPREKLRLDMDLVRLLETDGDLAAAQAQLESVYKANPLIAGVVRATVDYYWRHDKPMAIRVLSTAADHAYPSLKKDYLVETVHKSIEAGQPAEGVQAAQQLLRIDPIDGQFVALMADALSAGGRQAELQQLYTSKISEIQQSQIATADKTDRIAAMRRGLIPVLTRENKLREAIDQYIEIINRFPDDTNLLSEAGRFATQHDLRAQLIDYYTKTSVNSPKDPRWFIVLARLQTQFRDYPAAIDAYAKAITARPERQDLALARADLEERTSRFADAINTYNRVYELSHGNPVWLEHVARLQARLGQNREALNTLQRAYIDNRPEAERQYGKVAAILEDVGMIDSAVDFIQRQPDAGSSFVRIMAKARRYDDAIQRVFDRQDINAARVLGETAAVWFSPEETQTFLARLESRRQRANPTQRALLVNIATPARLYDLQVALEMDQDIRFGAPFEVLQQRRMRFTELARQLEDLAARSSVDVRLNLLMSAARSYQRIGAAADELQFFDRHPELQVNTRQRYYALLSEQRPDELLNQVTRSGPDASSLMATQAFIAVGDSSRAIQSIERQRRSPVWTSAYTGLTGLYFGLNSPEVPSAFQKALGLPLIQDRLGKPVDRNTQLAGNIWFYYGQRFGEYLRDQNQPQAADDYLWSELESRPGDPQAYLQIARYYSQTRAPERAITEFGHALELNGNQPAVHSEIALVEWDAGRQNEALTEWRTALDQFAGRPNGGDGARIIGDIRSRKQETVLHAEIDKALRAAGRGLQPWELPQLLRAAFEGSSDDQDFLDIIQSSREPGQLLMTLLNLSPSAPWLSDSQQKLVFETSMNLLAASPLERFQYQQIRTQYLEYLLNHNDAAGARKVLDSFSVAEKQTDMVRIAGLRLAAMENKLGDVLAGYTQNPAESPSDSALQQTAGILDRLGVADASRQVLEFLYTRQIDSSSNPAAYLGLAEIRVKQGRLDQAKDLLTTLNQIDAVPFDHLVASARVFSENGHPAEAQQFLRSRVQAVPWDYEARLESAKVEAALNQRNAATDDLQKIVSASAAPYDIRTQAAQEQAKTGAAPAGSTGSRELDILSNRIPLTADNADAPSFFAARLAAAERSNDPNVKLRLLLNAIAERVDDMNVQRSLFFAAIAAKQYRVALAVNFNRYPQDPEITAALADAHQQIGEFAQATQLYKTAELQEKDAARRQALEEKEKQAQAASNRNIENDRRKPVMRADLDQPSIVGRRLQ